MSDDRRIGVLGLARSGRAAAELAHTLGLDVYASDAGDSPALREAAARVRRAGGDADVGRHDADKLAACDLIVVSPGIPPNVSILRHDAVASVPRISELEFAFRHLGAPVIAVTGTNGKTTTTALAARLLEAAGFDAPAAGNIGMALSEVARRESPPDWAVVEASSFQLGGIDSFAPRIGVVTNLSPDHLDRYISVDAYYADKARFFENATRESVWILNGEDPAVEGLAGEAAGRRLRFRASGRPGGGAADAWVDAGTLVLGTDDDPVELVHADEMRLLGEHNRANALAAALAAAVAGVDVAALREGLRSFPPLEHRLQPVLEEEGVLWINDSKATNVGSTKVALRSMTRPVVLLLGGRPKREPFDALAPELHGRVRSVVAYGEAADRIERELAGTTRVERVAGGFDEAVAQARAIARAGDVVLLSPACASFDLFGDYEERGRRFAELARAGMEVPNGA